MVNTWKNELVGQEEFDFPPDPADDFDFAPATAEIAGNQQDLPLNSWQTTAVSRRDFLRGVVCSGVAVAAASYVMVGGSGAVKAKVRGVERLVSLKVNGKTRRVDVAPNETLAHTLRYRLGLTGTKIGCNRAECGACTVISDDMTIYSCSTLTHSVRKQEIRTIEGIAGPGGKLHAVQQAFIDELGPQCGFCTPGQVMSAVNLLEKNPKPTVAQAQRAMSGNLCRCGAYDHYLKGVMRAARSA